MFKNFKNLDIITNDIKNAKNVGIYKGINIPNKRTGFFADLLNKFAIKNLYKNRRGGGEISQLNLLKEYLIKGNNPNALIPPNNTPLLFNAKNEKEIGLLLAYGGDVNIKDKNGNTLLQKDLQILENTLDDRQREKISFRILLLLKNGANIEKDSAKQILNDSLLNKDDDLLKTLSKTIIENQPNIYNDFCEEKGISTKELSKYFSLEKEEEKNSFNIRKASEEERVSAFEKANIMKKDIKLKHDFTPSQDLEDMSTITTEQAKILVQSSNKNHVLTHN